MVHCSPCNCRVSRPGNAVGDGVGQGVGVSWVGLAPSWWVMWVMLCLNLIKIACICNYTYRIGGVPRGRSPHDPPRRKRMTHATTPRPPTQSPTQKPPADDPAACWADLDSRGHDPHDPHEHMWAHDPHDPRPLSMQLGGRDPHDPRPACCSAAFEWGGRARRRPVTLAKGPRTKFFHGPRCNTMRSTNLIHSRA